MRSPAAAGRASARTLEKLAIWGVMLMVLGWVFSCATRMYDVDKLFSEGYEAKSATAVSADGKRAPIAAARPEPRERDRERADSPVVPPKQARDSWLADLKAGKWSEVLAEAPFVPPPHSRTEAEEQLGWGRYATKAYWMEPAKRRGEDTSTNYRKLNYWMMSQRVGAISYLTFAAGLALLLYVVFYLMSDVWGVQIGVFRTLGVNALVGYILHGMVDRAVSAFMPKDVPGWYMLAGFAVFFFITWLFLRTLEKNRIYVKL